MISSPEQYDPEFIYSPSRSFRANLVSAAVTLVSALSSRSLGSFPMDTRAVWLFSHFFPRTAAAASMKPENCSAVNWPRSISHFIMLSCADCS